MRLRLSVRLGAVLEKMLDIKKCYKDLSDLDCLYVCGMFLSLRILGYSAFQC